MGKTNRISLLLASVFILSTVAACTPSGATKGDNTTAGQSGTVNSGSVATSTIAGNIETDGSSTVYPLSEAVIEEAKKVMPKLNVTASPSGSSAGIKRLIAGEIDIAAASRTIESEEIATAKAAGIEIIELQVGIDGIAVVANKNNPVDNLTFEDLAKIFAKDSILKTWKEVNVGFPDTTFSLFSPGSSSGTYEYFTEHVLKSKNEQRASDVQVSEDDNVLVTGVAGSEGGLGYFGFTYAEENADKLKIMKLNGIEANQENILNGTYPLARPLFLYVNKKAATEKPEVKAFLDFYLDNAITLAKDINMVPAAATSIEASKAALNK